MTQPGSLSSLTKNLSSRLDALKDQLDISPTAKSIENLEKAIDTAFKQINELFENKKNFGPLDSSFNDKKIEELQNRVKVIQRDFKLTQDRFKIQTAVEGTIEKVEKYQKDLLAAITAKNIDEAASASYFGREQLDLIRGKNLRISDALQDKIKKLDTSLLDGERACKGLRWEKSLEGADWETGTHSQFDLYGGPAICSCAAYRGLVASLSNSTETVDAILKDGLKNYKALIYFLQGQIRQQLIDYPEMEGIIQDIKYGHHLDSLAAQPVAPEVVPWTGGNGLLLDTIPIIAGNENQAVRNALASIGVMIPEGKTRVGRKIAIGDETYSIVLHKKEEDRFVVDIFDLQEGERTFHRRFEKVENNVHSAITFLEAEARKPGGDRTIKISNRDPIVEQFLIKGEEKETFQYMLTALSEIMISEGKNQIGAMFICGREFYSVVIRVSDDGACKVDFRDSHGSIYLPLNKAYKILFPNIEKAAEFLALRKKASDAEPQVDNECALRPFYLHPGPAVPSFLELHPLPEDVEATTLFEECLKTLAENDPAKTADAGKKLERTEKIKNWSETDFFPSLTPLHLKGLGKAICKVSNSPLFEKLDALMRGYEEKRDASSEQRMIKEEQLLRLLKDLETTLPEHYKAVTKGWLDDITDKGILKSKYSPNHRIVFLEKYLAGQLAIQWNSLPHPDRLAITENYIQRSLKSHLTETEIKKQKMQCQQLAAAIETVSSRDEVIKIQKEIEGLKEPIVDLIKLKVADRLNEENANKLKELEESCKNLYVLFNKAIRPFEIDLILETFEILNSTLQTGIHSKQEGSEVYGQLQEMVKDIVKFKSENNPPDEKTTKKFEAVEKAFNDTMYTFEHAFMSYYMTDYQTRYGKIVEDLSVEKITRETLQVCKANILALNTEFDAFCNNPYTVNFLNKDASDREKNFLVDIKAMPDVIKVLYDDLDTILPKPAAVRNTGHTRRRPVLPSFWPFGKK